MIFFLNHKCFYFYSANSLPALASDEVGDQFEEAASIKNTLGVEPVYKLPYPPDSVLSMNFKQPFYPAHSNFSGARPDEIRHGVSLCWTQVQPPATPLTCVAATRLPMAAGRPGAAGGYAPTTG